MGEEGVILMEQSKPKSSAVLGEVRVGGQIIKDICRMLEDILLVVGVVVSLQSFCASRSVV